MSDIAIRIENVGKKYRIGRRDPYTRLSEAPIRLGRAAGCWLRNRFSANGEATATPAASPSNEFWALRDISLEIKRGEVLGVIGRNGAGKSTLLKILSRITRPTTGQIELFGRVGSLLEVGTGFHPELTGRENIFLNGTILGMRRAEIARKFDEIVAFAEIEQFLDTPVKHYSSGMYMRLAFAVAAHLEPEILLVDEVLAVGDAAFQRKCLGKMNEVARHGRTVLFVSHNMNAVEELCRCAVLLDGGRAIVADRDVRGVIARYLGGGNDANVAEWRGIGSELSNHYFQPKRFWIGDRQGTVASLPLRNDDDAYVFIEGEVERLDPALNVGYALFTTEGRLLYWTLTTDAELHAWPRIEPGRVCFRSHVPRRLLNEGEYRLEMIVSLHFREWIAEPGVNAPAIVLSIRGGLSDSPYWMLARPGLLAPTIPWDKAVLQHDGYECCRKENSQ